MGKKARHARPGRKKDSSEKHERKQEDRQERRSNHDRKDAEHDADEAQRQVERDAAKAAERARKEAIDRENEAPTGQIPGLETTEAAAETLQEPPHPEQAVVTDYRHAGMGWPTGPEPADILDLPGSVWLLCDPEHWHLPRLQQERPNDLVIARSIAVPPASIGWNVDRYCDAVLKEWGRYAITDLQYGNEWNLNYERGDNDDDWDPAVMRRVYESCSAFSYEVAVELRRRLAPTVRIHSPPWAPDHFLHDVDDPAEYGDYDIRRPGDNVPLWMLTAARHNVISIHAYGSLDRIKAEYRFFRKLFPNHFIVISEWNSGDQLAGLPEAIENERQVLEWLATLHADDPLFLGACYFNFRWHGGATDIYDVETRPDRLALFRDPPRL